MRRTWHWYRSRRARTQWGVALGALFVGLAVLGSLSPSQQTASNERAIRTSPATPTAAAATGTAAARPTPSARASASPTATRLASRGAAVAALEALPVKGRASKTDYSRERFGDGWATVAGCDMRDRILRRDLTRKTYAPGETCAVQSGRLNDPYSAATIMFVRGGASEVDIDHVVALADAWQKGAQQWSVGRRVAFANDPLNLLSVDAHVNRAKGDGDAATWLPPNKRFRCAYVARQVAVKRRYHMWVTRAEHDAIARVLATCPN